MELSAVADDLNEVSVLVNVAHRLLLTIRDVVDGVLSSGRWEVARLP
jgi:hypothetical protein